jgi:hypothetical protein
MKLKITHEIKEIEYLKNEKCFQPMFITIKISDIPQYWANAIRRILVDEYPIKVLELTKFECGDKYIKEEVLKYQLSTLRIDQDLPNDTIFALKVSGNTIPMTSHFLISKTDTVGGSTRHAINQNVELIEQVQFVNTPTIIEAKVATYYKHIWNQGSCSLVTQLTCLPDKNDIMGPQDYTYILDMQNNIDPKKLISTCISEIIRRLTAAKTYTLTRISTIEENDDNSKTSLEEYIILYENETITLGNLIYDAVYWLDPNIPLVTFYRRDVDVKIKFTVPSESYLKNIMDRALDYAITEFQTLL